MKSKKIHPQQGGFFGGCMISFYAGVPGNAGDPDRTGASEESKDVYNFSASAAGK